MPCVIKVKKSQVFSSSASIFTEVQVWSSVYKSSQQSHRVTDFP